MSKRQLVFQMFENEFKKDFGGALLRKSNARERRPISTKDPMHLVMRSEMATGEYSLLKKQTQIKALIDHAALRNKVKVYRLANSGNHLHLIVLPTSRKAFNNFIRVTTGLIARLVLGVERGCAKGIKFWDARPYTRILSWGREWKTVVRYLKKNVLEALGFIPHQPRKQKSNPAKSPIRQLIADPTDGNTCRAVRSVIQIERSQI